MNKSDINCWFEIQSITVIKMTALSESPVLLPRTMENTSKIISCDTLPNASVKLIKVTIIFVLKCLKLSISVFNKKISSCRSRFSKYALCQNAISLDTNVMIRLRKHILHNVIFSARYMILSKVYIFILRFSTD